MAAMHQPRVGAVFGDSHTWRLPAGLLGALSIILRKLRVWRERRRLWESSPMMSGREVAVLATLPPSVFDVLDDLNRRGADKSSKAWRVVETERQYLIDAAKWS
jgi:hypothetical protein